MSELERRLHEAAPYYEFPETPSVASAVRLPDRPARRFGGAALVAAAALVALGAVLAVSRTARASLLEVIDAVPGVEIRLADELPQAVPFFRFEAGLGRAVSLDEARRDAGFELLLPRDVGDPDRVYLDSGAAGTAVTAVWGAAGRRARIVFSQWHPSTLLFEKLVASTAAPVVVEVDGERGLWIAGPDHEVFYLGRGRASLRAPPYLAGNTLVWERAGVTYRLEADVTLERALELARLSSRPSS